ncbi:hypothetical protein AHAS_Ahas18G0221900 [Arachis hypogaea]
MKVGTASFEEKKKRQTVKMKKLRRLVIPWRFCLGLWNIVAITKPMMVSTMRRDRNSSGVLRMLMKLRHTRIQVSERKELANFGASCSGVAAPVVGGGSRFHSQCNRCYEGFFSNGNNNNSSSITSNSHNNHHNNELNKSLIRNNRSFTKITTLWFKLTLIATSVLAALFIVASILVFSSSIIQTTWKVLNGVFWLVQAITQIVLTIMIIHEKRFEAVNHPVSLRIYCTFLSFPSLYQFFFFVLGSKGQLGLSPVKTHKFILMVKSTYLRPYRMSLVSLRLLLYPRPFGFG